MKPQKGWTVTFQPEGRKTVVQHGVTLLEAARKAGVVLPTRCGGKAGCLMCKVTVPQEEAAALRPPGMPSGGSLAACWIQASVWRARQPSGTI